MLISTAQAIHTDKKNLGLFGAFGAVSVVFSLASNRIAKTDLVNYLAYYTNTDAKDLVDCATLSTLCWSSSYLPSNRNIQNFLRISTLISPIIQILATSKRWNRLLNKTPLINMFLDCRNPECEGICDQCKLTALYKKVPFELVSLYLLPPRTSLFAVAAPVYGHHASRNDGEGSDDSMEYGEKRDDGEEYRRQREQEKQDRIFAERLQKKNGQERQDQEDKNACPICLQDEDEMDDPVEMCVRHHKACRACSQKWETRNPICPLCRAPMLIF